MYQCNYQNVNNTLKLAIIYVGSDQSNTFDKVQMFMPMVYQGSLQIKNPIFDIGLLNATLSGNSL